MSIDNNMAQYCKSADVLWLLNELEDKSNDSTLGIQDNIFYHRAKIRILKLMKERYMGVK